MLKDLKVQEKEALKFQLGELLEHDEPSAILATLHRVAERKAYACTRGRQDMSAAIAWQELADALASVRAELVLTERKRARLTAI
jgi:NAD-dependent oxidoreductase involved in siderophore biosynthesis